MAVYNVDKISDWYDAFISAKNKFNNTYYEAYKSSYISSCSDSTINKIRYVLNSHYGRIYRIYNNINKVWSRYLEDLKNTDNRLAGGKGGINASSVSAKLSKLPELKDYKRDLSVRIKSASAVIGINGDNKLNDLRNSYDSFTEYTGARASTWLNSIFENLNDSLKDTGAKISGLFKDDSKANSDVSDIANPKLDEGIFNKTTIMDNEENRMEYSKKVKNDDGSIEYFDEYGKLIKKIMIDGTVLIYDNSILDPKITQYNSDQSYSIINEGDGSLSSTIKKYYDKNNNLIRVEDYGGTKIEDITPSKINYYTEYKDGNEYTYFANGNLRGVDNQDGSYTRYYENGKISRKHASDGSEISYFENGKISCVKQDSDNYTYYDIDGNYKIECKDGKETITKYQNGKEVSTYQCDIWNDNILIFNGARWENYGSIEREYKSNGYQIYFKID